MDEKTHQTVGELVIDEDSNHFSGSSLLFILCGLIAILFALFLFLYNFSLTRTNSDLIAQKADLVSQISTPENLKTESLVNSTAAAITDLKSLYDPNTFKDSNFLTEFPKIVNKNVAIQNLSLGADNNLKIDGSTANMTSLGAFMESLKASKYLTNIVLLGVNNNAGSGAAATTFSLSTVLDRGKAYAETMKTTTVAPDTTTPLTTSTTENPNPTPAP